MNRPAKKIPEYVYFRGEGYCLCGPFVNKRKGIKQRKFKLVEVEEDKDETKSCNVEMSILRM